MKIQEMFVKPIDRDLKGVIKVGQEEDSLIQQELEEYVVTNELKKHFAKFFSAYKNGIIGNTDKMGVWISGFFGSGKSHLLKILSYLLANTEVDGKKAIDYFIEGNKISDSMVLADMKLAADTSTDVILFNIDSKSETTGRHDREAILAVFLKVFNEMRGFYGANAHIADLERRLSDEGRYEEFKEKFEELNGESWLEARNEFDFNQDETVDTLVEMNFMSEEAARNWCEKANTPYQISIENFAKNVKKYIDSKGKNHHVVFLVDEIGQFIGSDTQLMLNLQTVTEDLGTACKGKVWIVVTSQEDIDSVIKVKGNDFSKILGRFDTRLSLSSANVDEVIRKRILEKNPVATQTLSVLYDEKTTILKNLILFDEAAEQKFYAGRADFAAVYPFIPYQFDLLGNVLTAIRTHGASGKHLADGARSMLALFKESAATIKNKDVGELIPFHMFYDTLEEFIEHTHRDVITKAKRNDYINPDREENCFAVNVLKALFLIKYVKEIKATVNNIASLMVHNVDDERLVLVKKVEEAVKVLEKQTLIQKRNNEYVFLTDEEQDINRAIQKQDVDSAELTNRISEIIFDGLFADKKYRYPAFNNRYAFAFNQVVDGHPYKGSSGYDLTLKILTPNCDENTDEATMRLASAQSSSVLVVLPDDRAFLEEILAAAKIEKYLRYDVTGSNAKHEEIKTVKKVEMREHSQNARTYLEESLRAAEIYVNGDKLQSAAKDISGRINDALSKLVATVYHKLTYIDAAMSESDIRSLFKANNAQTTLNLGTVKKNELALNDVRDYIALNSQKHTKTSMKTLLDRFMKSPYGFVEDDVKWLVAKLFRDGDIILSVNNEVITTYATDADTIVNYITKKAFYDKLMTEKKERPGEPQIRSVREVMKELFNVTSSAEDEESLMSSFLSYAGKLKNDLASLDIYYKTQKGYPGQKIVSTGKKLMSDVLQIKYSGEFFREIHEKKDDYLDFAEDYRPVKAFFGGEQKTIFDRSLDYLKIYQESKNFFVDKQTEEAAGEIRKILKTESPYNLIHKLPDLNQKYMQYYMAILETQAEPVKDAIEDAQKRVFDELKGKNCEYKLKDNYYNQFKELKDKAESSNNIAVLQNIRIEADALKIRLLNEIPVEEAKLMPKEPGPKIHTPQPPYRKTKTFSIKSLTNASTWQIKTPEDVEKYIDELKKKLLNSLEEDTTLNIEF